MNKHKSRRRLSLAFASLAVSATMLVGCSAASGGGVESTAGPADSKIGGTLTFLAQGDAATAKNDPLAAEFEKKYPDVDVKIEYSATKTWDAFFSDLQTRLAAGKNYDLIYLPTEGERLLASKGLVQPLDSWIARDKSEMDAFYADANPTIVEDAKEKSSTDGSTYYIPYLFNTMGMYVNKSTFENAGVPLPTAGWTWDDFRATCEALQKASVQYCFDASSGYFDGISPWLATNGADVMNADWDQATADTPQAIEAATFTRGLVADGLTPVPGGSYDQNALFAQGKIAMIGGGAWPTTSLLAANLKLSDFEIVPWPTQTQQGSPVGWGAQAMLKSSNNKEAAWAYIKFLTSPEAQDLIGANRLNDAIPVLQSSIDKAKATNPEGYSYLFDALDYATPVPGPAAALAVQQTVQEKYLSILTGNSSPEQGMKDMNSAISDEIK
ncbi:MAG: extracellular solute-binding protein [Subtercola sp.]|nr:extracellular solute-binding protein [Subtercola sp.]